MQFKSYPPWLLKFSVFSKSPYYSSNLPPRLLVFDIFPTTPTIPYPRLLEALEYLSASAYHVISKEVENHIFRHNCMFRYTCMHKQPILTR